MSILIKIFYFRPGFRKLTLAFCAMQICVCLLSVSSCKQTGDEADAAGPDEYYTCSMDPQVIENKAGTCPICRMKLIKVKRNNLKAGQIKLSTQQIKLGNITYDTLRVRELAKEITLTGKVTTDQNYSVSISTYVQGRIERLTVKNVGDYIEKGQLLYEIYSEDLILAQQEYILSQRKMNGAVSTTEAAKNKLRLYGMTEVQINRLKTTGKIMLTVPVYSGVNGYVNEISVAEGNYVSPETILFRVGSLQSLWVEAQVYLMYLPFLKRGTVANFLIPAASETNFTGKVIFIDPQVQAPERFVLARFQINNPSQQIKPGMLASITLQTEKKKCLAVPVDAVILDSQGTNVWVWNGEGVFENKMVTMGMQNSSVAEIVSGLKAGDIVVATGAYLLNSEYVFKKGANPMEGHSEMPGMKM